MPIVFVLDRFKLFVLGVDSDGDAMHVGQWIARHRTSS
ncbi:unnamed protein product [Acidithrix sp. C25]|nr:unnamed protein product [Acidithrix sp. C25]